MSEARFNLVPQRPNPQFANDFLNTPKKKATLNGQDLAMHDTGFASRTLATKGPLPEAAAPQSRAAKSELLLALPSREVELQLFQSLFHVDTIFGDRSILDVLGI